MSFKVFPPNRLLKPFPTLLLLLLSTYSQIVHIGDCQAAPDRANTTNASQAQQKTNAVAGKTTAQPTASQEASKKNQPVLSEKDKALADKLSGEPVMVYLRNGDDLTGQLIAFQPNALVLKTRFGVRALPFREYYGMVLDTPQEKSFGEKMTRNEDAFSEAMAYTQKIRPLLEKQMQNNLKYLPDVCSPKTLPVMHIRVKKAGGLDNAKLIARSNCPQLNLAISQASKQITFPALSKAYPFDVYIFNYFYRPDANGKPAPAKAENNSKSTPPKTTTPTKPNAEQGKPKSAEPASKTGKP